jgi:hypothetical protein
LLLRSNGPFSCTIYETLFMLIISPNPLYFTERYRRGIAVLLIWSIGYRKSSFSNLFYVVSFGVILTDLVSLNYTLILRYTYL